MKKKKEDDKEKYRKKPYTPRFKTHLAKDYQSFIKEFKKISKKSPIHILQFLEDKFGIPGVSDEKNKDLKIVVFCKDEKLREILIDLGNKGANISLISDALQSPDIPEYLKDDHPSALKLHKGELSPEWNEIVKDYNVKRTNFKKNERALRGTIGQIKSLEPIPETVRRFNDELPFVNTKLKELQDAVKEFERVLDIYFNAKAISAGIIRYSEKWGLPINKLMEKNYRPISQKSHNIWSDKIVVLVNEIERIGYSFEQAYTITADLLNLAYPHIYQDPDLDLVRQRYTYHKKKAK